MSTVSFALESYVWILGPWGQGEAEETLENKAVSLGYTPTPTTTCFFLTSVPVSLGSRIARFLKFI